MSDIPQDIWEKADAAHLAAIRADTTEDEVNIIAKAVMEERIRCAEIANTVQPVETHNSYFHEGWDAASMTIASAIMGEEK